MIHCLTVDARIGKVYITTQTYHNFVNGIPDLRHHGDIHLFILELVCILKESDPSQIISLIIHVHHIHHSNVPFSQSSIGSIKQEIYVYLSKCTSRDLHLHCNVTHKLK